MAHKMSCTLLPQRADALRCMAPACSTSPVATPVYTSRHPVQHLKQQAPCVGRSRRDSKVLCSVNERQELRTKSHQGTSMSGSTGHHSSHRKNVQDALERRQMPYGLVAVLASAGCLETAYLALSKLLNSPITCPTSGSCDTVLNSGYASVFGLPLPLLGCAVYGGVALLAGRQSMALATRARQGPHDLNRTRYAILAGATVLASTSGYLLYLLATVFAGETCTWCLASAALSAGVFLAAARGFTTQELAEAAGPGSGLVASTILALALAWSNVEVPEAQAGFELPYSEPRVTGASSARAAGLVRRLRAAGARMYGAFWCSHCFEQKQAFGAQAAAELPYVECYPDGYFKDVKLAQACVDANLTGFPAWIINGKKLDGEQSFDKLEAELAAMSNGSPAAAAAAQ